MTSDLSVNTVYVQITFVYYKVAARKVDAILILLDAAQDCSTVLCI